MAYVAAELMRLPLLLLALGLVQAAPAATVNYTLTPVLTDEVLTAVQIDVRFRGTESGTTGLSLPDAWGGQAQLWHELEDLRVVSGARLGAGASPAERVLRHRAGASVHIRYRVVQNWSRGPAFAEDGNPYRPIIQPGYFHLIGYAAFVLPELDVDTPARVRVRGLPAGWRFASDLEHADLRLREVRASVSVGGDFRILDHEASGLRVAIRGHWSFDDAQLMASVARIVSGHRRFWNEADEPLLVTAIELTPPDPGISRFGGTSLDGSFALFATSDKSLEAILPVLAHEDIHTWIPRRIGDMPEQDEAGDYWLSEGFSEFYTARLLVADGTWGPREFAENLNRMLADYAKSPARAFSNARILADFWNDPAVQQLPYQRGRLLATAWDARLRAGGEHDFDEVILGMRERVQAGAAGTAVELLREVTAAMGFDLADDLRRHVAAGEPVILPEDAFAPCGRVATRRIPAFDLGFDVAATKANLQYIRGTDPDSRAYAAGLRDGMKLVRRISGKTGHSETEMAYLVVDGERKREIRYLPQGKVVHIVQSLEIDPGLDATRLAQCRRVLGGSGQCAGCAD